MDLLTMINDQFESLYPEDEIQSAAITSDEINEITDMAGIPLPQMLKEIFEKGKIHGVRVKEKTSIIIQLLYPADIINVDDNYPYFKEDVKEGLIFATDLGDNVYYYGRGHDGPGLYIVGAGDGNFFEDATKFANTFEDFFIDGKGIDILKRIM